MRSVERGVAALAVSPCGFGILPACARSEREGEVVHREVLADDAVAQRYRSEALAPERILARYSFVAEVTWPVGRGGIECSDGCAWPTW